MLFPVGGSAKLARASLFAHISSVTMGANTGRAEATCCIHSEFNLHSCNENKGVDARGTRWNGWLLYTLNKWSILSTEGLRLQRQAHFPVQWLNAPHVLARHRSQLPKSSSPTRPFSRQQQTHKGFPFMPWYSTCISSYCLGSCLSKDLLYIRNRFYILAVLNCSRVTVNFSYLFLLFCFAWDLTDYILFFLCHFY